MRDQVGQGRHDAQLVRGGPTAASGHRLVDSGQLLVRVEFGVCGHLTAQGLEIGPLARGHDRHLQQRR